MVVATAAPVTPSAGNGPTPNTSIGPSTMLMPLASHSVRIAIAGSPAPRKAALIMNSRITVTLPPSMMRGKRPPIAITSGRRAHCGEQAMPRKRADDADDDRQAEHRARWLAPPRAPHRRDRFPADAPRATIAAPPIDNPIANEYTMTSIDSVNTTVAVAEAPSFDTQKMSASENSDSINISPATIGIASSRTARRTGSAVKSCRVPASASRTRLPRPSPRRAGAIISGESVVVSVVIGMSSCRDDEAEAPGSTAD